MKIMIYTRPWTGDYFHRVARKVFRDPTLISYSDFRGIADLWAGKYIYDEKYDTYNEAFEKNADDIIDRCRILRRLSREFAYMLARRYWNGMEELFDEEQFDYIIITPVDIYCLDVICRVAERKGVRIICAIGAPFANYAKITVRGEYNRVRVDVSEEEVTRLVEQMTQDTYLTPSEIKNIKRTHKLILRYYYRRMLIECIYYPLMCFIKHDPWNYNYNCHYVKEQPLKLIYNKNFDNMFKTIKDIAFDAKKTVYYPMHLVPEATTDYWCDGIGRNYNKYVIDMIRNADPDITFIIKEHPAMYGKRLLSFYRLLNSMPNVILLHPKESSNVLLTQVENVVVDNGTVGIEALIRGKRVIVLANNYYYSFHPNAFRTERITHEVLSMPLKEYDNKAFIRELLKGCFVSDFADSRWGTKRSDPEKLADGIIQYLDLNHFPR